ncbi:mitochondrial proton/calcium exchanger protein-like protein isoform X1 [Tanacetum coccineum]
MEEINNFQQEPDENLYQAWERFKELLMKCPQYYLTEMQEVVLFYNGLDVPTRQILDSRGAIPSKTAADAKVAIQEMVEYSQEWHNGTSRTRRGGYRETTLGFYQRNNASPSYQERRKSMEETLSKFMGESAKRHEENSNLIKEIRVSTDAGIRNQGASIKTLKIQIGQMSKSISTIVEADASSIHPYSYGASHIDKSIPRKEKDPGSFTLPCYINNVCFNNALADLGASVSVMPFSTYLNLGLGELGHTKLTVELADRTMKYPKGIAENMLVGIGKFVFPIDFIILGVPEDIKVPLILGRLFLSTAHAKIDVFKRKITLRVGEEKIIFKSVKPASSLIKRVYMLSLRERMELDLEARLMGETLLRRDQVDDLMPTVEEGKVVEEFRARNDAKMVSEIFGYPSDCDHDKKIRIDCAHNLKFSCMIDFAVLEDMDAYRDEGMGDVTDIQEKDKNRSQIDKTEHENGKSVKQKPRNQSQVKVKKSTKVNPEQSKVKPEAVDQEIVKSLASFPLQHIPGDMSPGNVIPSDKSPGKASNCRWG